MRGLLAALFVLAAVVQPVTADHPGSNQGLSRLSPLGLDQVVHRLPDVQQSFADWETAYPGLVSRMVIGETNTGFPLEGILVTDEAVAYDAAATPMGHKFRVYLDGGHHGNEFLGVELVMYYLEDLLAQADAGDNATLALLATTEIYAVPIVNVDGNYLDTRKNSNQVDVNRNYEYDWGGPGSGSLPTDSNYRGPSPGSEMEVRANMVFGRAIWPDVWVTMHTGVAEFYWPWGNTEDDAPDHVFFEGLEGPFQNATNGRVDAMQAAELYLAAGATDDWAYATLGIPAHTFEVHEDQFIPVYGEPINDVITDQLAGLDFVVRNVQFWGANLVPTATADGLVIQNIGWNLARNATLGSERLPDIAPGESITVAAPAEDTQLSYAQMLIATSKVRTVPVAGVAAPETPSESASAPVAIVALATLGLLAASRRRSGVGGR